MDEEQIKQFIRDELSNFLRNNRYVFDKQLQLLNGKNIIVGTGTGTEIATETTQKLGFYGTTPVDQPATVADPSGGATQDAEARTAINAIIDRLQELGLVA